MKEFDVAGQRYQAGKLNAFKQFHIMRRLAPIFTSLKDIKFTPEDKIDLRGTDFGPVALALSNLSDDDSNYIIFSCLEVCRRFSGSAWAKINSGGNLMFQDIDMAALIQITWIVLMDNFESFFSEAPLPSSGDGAVSRQA